MEHPARPVNRWQKRHGRFRRVPTSTTMFAVPASDASTLYQYPVLLFTLAMAALVPVIVRGVLDHGRA